MKEYKIDFERLKSQQKDVAQAVIDYIEGKTSHAALLVLGYAGTGKTYTATEFIKWLAIQLKKKVLVTAPTNKAVKVLDSSADYEHWRVQYMTCHRMLGLKPGRDDDSGKLIFERSKDPNEEEETLNDKTVVVVDETSMFPDELFHFLYPEVVKANAKLIFIGDPAQIPPVNKFDCIPFQNKMRELYKIGVVEMTEIVRQAAGNPILNFATLLRENLSMPIDSPRKSMITEHGGIIAINKAEKGFIREICQTYFDTPHFKENADFMKVIAWRNVVVDAVNAVVRGLIYKQAVLPKILPGEKLIADSPIMDPASAMSHRKWILMNTNDEMEVISCEETSTVIENRPIEYYRTHVKHLNSSGVEKIATIHIIHERSEAVWKELLDMLARYAKNAPREKKGYFWKSYYATKEMFAEVKYNYAITTHKAQGSTYDNCMVVDWDLQANPKCIERNRIRYVAFTRPRNYLFSIYE